MESISSSACVVPSLLDDVFGDLDARVTTRNVDVGQELVPGLHERAVAYLSIGPHHPDVPVVLEERVDIDVVVILGRPPLVRRRHLEDRRLDGLNRLANVPGNLVQGYSSADA